VANHSAISPFLGGERERESEMEREGVSVRERERERKREKERERERCTYNVYICTPHTFFSDSILLPFEFVHTYI